MADRIQQRRDTLVKWQSVNPVLLEGEIAFITDYASYYKMGDGIHSFNELPFRGWDGTLVQEVGDNPLVVMSQKAVTDAIEDCVEVGDPIGDPAGDWVPGTAEAYIDAQISNLKDNAGASYNTLGKLETAIKAEAQARESGDAVLRGNFNARMDSQDEAIATLNGNDVIPVDAVPAVGSAVAGKIYRLVGSTSYQDWMKDMSVTPNEMKMIAEYAFPGIDNKPTPGSDNLVKSSGVAGIEDPFDVTAYNSGTRYAGLAAAIAGSNVPASIHRGGMSIRFINSTTGKYEWWRLLAPSWSTTTSDWGRY